MKSKSNLKEDLKSPWLLGIIGIVLVALVVNGIMIGVSFANPNSLVVKDYYKKGKAYFHDRAEHENHAAKSGYKLKIITPQKIHANREELIDLKITAINEKKINGSSGILYIYKTDDMKKDFKKELLPVKNGMFQAHVNFPFAGNWDLIAQVVINGEKFDVAQRVFVRK